MLCALTHRRAISAYSVLKSRVAWGLHRSINYEKDFMDRRRGVGADDGVQLAACGWWEQGAGERREREHATAGAGAEGRAAEECADQEGGCSARRSSGGQA